ncbi:MAG: hypothetical protein ACYDH6_11080 [Acidimicrobiales bacterium]
MMARFRRTGRQRRPLALGDAHQGQVERRQAAAIRLVGRGTPAAARIESAPPGYLLVHGPSDVARHCALLSPLPAAGQARVVVTPGRAAHEWRLDVAGRDRPGLLAAFTGVLTAEDIEVVQAVLATWDDGAALEAFVVRAAVMPEPGDLQASFQASLVEPLSARPVGDAEVGFDGGVSALYTACDVRATDRPGLLHAIAVAITSAGGDVHAARVTTVDGVAHDHFDLSDRAGNKLTAGMEAAIRQAIVGGVGSSQAGLNRS